jgi:hypothetical protein
MAGHRLFVMNIYKLVACRLLTKAPAGQASIHLTESHTCSSDIMVKNHQYFTKLLSGICQKGCLACIQTLRPYLTLRALVMVSWRTNSPIKTRVQVSWDTATYNLCNGFG